MELPDLGLVAWVPLVLGFVFMFSYKYFHAFLCIIGG